MRKKVKKSVSIDPRKRPTQARSRETVEAIVEATTRVLATNGYDKASTNHIAAKAGVSIGSVYQYFPSKEALVGAVIDRHMAEMTQLVREGFERAANAPIDVAARELVATMIDAHAIDPKLHRTLAENTARVGRGANLSSIDNENIRLVRAYLEQYRTQLSVDDLDLAAIICVTTVEALTHMTVLHRTDLIAGRNRQIFVNEVANLLVRYLTTP